MKKTLLILLVVQFSSLHLWGQFDLEAPFIECNVNGSFTLYDFKIKKWISSDIDDSHLQTLPASTFKIVNTLIALESGAIKDENEIIKWPGFIDTAKYGNRPEIYHDMSMKEAFKVSAGWAYIELAKKIGKEKYRKYLAECNYGNLDLSINDYDFWNFGSLAISPSNQIKILIGVFEETLPFKKESFKILKEMMIIEETENYILRAKTGWTRYGDKDTGWWVGYVEWKDNVYFFATRLIKERDILNKEFGECRKQITRTILKQLNILK